MEGKQAEGRGSRVRGCSLGNLTAIEGRGGGGDPLIRQPAASVARKTPAKLTCSVAAAKSRMAKQCQLAGNWNQEDCVEIFCGTTSLVIRKNVKNGSC